MTALFCTAIAIATTPAAVFVASDSIVTFALNIPQADDSNDLYFTLAGPSSSSWIVSHCDSRECHDRTRQKFMGLTLMMYRRSEWAPTKWPIP